MKRRVGPWYRNAFGEQEREFAPDLHGKADVAAFATSTHWYAWSEPYAPASGRARGTAADVSDAMAQADAQLRAWGIEVDS